MPSADAPETVTEAVQQLTADGYTYDFHVSADGVHCPACGTAHPLDGALVERVHRFEGPSDPADEAIVLGLRCASCGERGSFVSAFGPAADPELLGSLVMLASRGPT